MASDVSQRAREAAANVLDEVSALIGHEGIGQVADLIRDGEYDEHDIMPIIARFEAEIRAETALPPILIDPTGKGYPTDERPMTVAEFEAVIRADATAIERERCATLVKETTGSMGPMVRHLLVDAIRKGSTHDH